MDEIWKDIVGFPGYQASNLGNIRNKKGRVLKGGITNCGYHQLGLYQDKKNYPRYAHRLVYEAFTGILPVYVDHIDGNKLNNKLDNLRACTPRENAIYYLKSKYPGTSYYAPIKKWRACISVNGKNVHLGSHDTQEQAHEAWLKKKKELGE